jgi:uncharacterized membrane protein YbhN (UPF0104 family)
MALVMLVGIVIVTLFREKVLLLLERLTKYLPQRIQKYVSYPTHSVFSSLSILQDQRSLFGLSFWSVVIWGTALLTNHLTLLAIGINLPITSSLLILIGLQVGITLPSIPGRVGIFEYICVLALAVFSIERHKALGYGFLLHGVVFLPTTLISLLLFIPLMGNPLRFDNLKMNSAGRSTDEPSTLTQIKNGDLEN